MQDLVLEYLLQLLKFCEKELAPGGVVGATLWKVC